MRPTQQGTVYLWTIAVFSLTLLGFGENLVFLLGTFALGCAAVAWFLARRNVGALTVRRELPRRATVGTAAPIAWHVRNERRGARVGLEVDDRAARGMRPASLRFEYPSVPGREEVGCSGTVVFGRRGLIDLGRGEAEVSSCFPLGLFRAARALRVAGRVLVRPREGRATALLRRRVRGRRPAEARRRRLWRGDDVIYGVREFRDGDDPRRIHWRSTARRGALVVSEWRAEQGRHVALVLGRGPGAGAAAAASFERAVSATATLWRLCGKEHMRTQLLLGGSRDPCLEDTGRGLEHGLDALAVVAAQGRRRPRGALRRLADAPGSRTVIYIASGDERGLEAELAAAAGRGGDWFVIRTHDDSLSRWVRGLER